MAKKSVGKKSIKKKTSHSKSVPKRNTEKLLVENFVALQKVMTNLSGKFDGLSRQISQLLKLFEDSAKVVVKNEIEKKNDDKGEKQMLDAMVQILDQNKIIAKGLTLMYETLTDNEGSSSKQTMKVVSPPTLKKVQAPTEKKRTIKEEDDYSSSRGADSDNSSDLFSMGR